MSLKEHGSDPTHGPPLSSHFDTANAVAFALQLAAFGGDNWEAEALTPGTSRSPSPLPEASQPSSRELPASNPSPSPPSPPGLMQRKRRRSPSPERGRSVASTPAPPAAQSNSSRAAQRKREHAKKGKRARKAALRQQEKDEQPFSKKTKICDVKRRGQMEPIHGQIPLESLPIAEGAFVGMNLKIERASAPALQQLLDQGYHYIEWDGRERREVLDGQGRVIAVLAGQPEDPSWSKVIEQANAAMRTARSKCTIDAAHHVHRRGVFATLARGFSFGGGRKVPGPIVNSPQNEDALAELCQSSAMKRLAGYGHSMLASYAPAIFANMRTQLKALAEHHPSLPPFNFQNSTYPAASFNFGPSAVCFIHTDAANDPCNMCHIVALGEYNPDTSGHIVFPDLMLVVRFPPGASILIPSAILRHGNTPIQPGEERMSFTQYCAGGLMRWVECGFRTVAAFRTEDPDAYAMYQAGLKHRADRC